VRVRCIGWLSGGFFWRCSYVCLWGLGRLESRVGADLCGIQLVEGEKRGWCAVLNENRGVGSVFGGWGLSGRMYSKHGSKFVGMCNCLS
jgi:hypothetical protein